MLPRQLAQTIWNAGVDRVRADRLISESVHVEAGVEGGMAGMALKLGHKSLALDSIRDIAVVGAGKAAGYLAVALSKAVEAIVSETASPHESRAKSLHGWVNVPANCVVESPRIRLHAARPAGVNEPREEGVEGTAEILRLVRSLDPTDLCICLITGGGSALLPAPKAGITLDDKLLVTRLMSSRGASIQELNCVRIALSDIKGGGLARACSANQLVTLIVSDIIGDPLDLIASGPTIPVQVGDVSPSSILNEYVKTDEVPSCIWNALDSAAEQSPMETDIHTTNVLLGNNETAVRAASDCAIKLGLEPTIVEPEAAGTSAESVATSLIDKINQITTKGSSRKGQCIIWGGEPIVRLHESPGKGGRNQQLVLAILNAWNKISATARDRLCVLSGGTDGEDGPTDAAGAFVDAGIVRNAEHQSLNIAKALQRNDAYPIFDTIGGLITTGPTHTNVCDLRVAVLEDGH